MAFYKKPPATGARGGFMEKPKPIKNDYLVFEIEIKRKAETISLRLTTKKTWVVSLLLILIRVVLNSL